MSWFKKRKKLHFVKFPNREEEVITVYCDEKKTFVPNEEGVRSIGYICEATKHAEAKDTLCISTYGPNQNNFDSYAIVWYYE